MSIISGVWPGLCSAGRHLGLCCCIFDRWVQPTFRQSESLVLLGRFFPGWTSLVFPACLQLNSSQISPFQPDLTHDFVNLRRMVHRWGNLPPCQTIPTKFDTARGICDCRHLCYYSLYKKYSPRRPLLFPAWKSAHNWFRSRCCCRLWPYNSHLQVFWKSMYFEASLKHHLKQHWTEQWLQLQGFELLVEPAHSFPPSRHPHPCSCFQNRRLWKPVLDRTG